MRSGFFEPQNPQNQRVDLLECFLCLMILKSPKSETEGGSRSLQYREHVAVRWNMCYIFECLLGQ